MSGAAGLALVATLLGIPHPAVAQPPRLATMPRTSAPPTAPRVPALDRYPVAIPPVYARPPAGFRPLPSSGPPLVFPGDAGRQDDYRWVPGRLEVVPVVDANGRVTHILEYQPGQFAR